MNPLIGGLIEVLQMVTFVAFAVLIMEVYLWFHFKKYNAKFFEVMCLIGTPLLTLLLMFAAYGTSLTAGPVAKILGFVFVLEIFFMLLFKHAVKGRWSLPFMLVIPGLVGLSLLLAYPFLFEIYLAFHDLKLTTLKQWSETGELPFVGIKYFIEVFTLSPLSEATFWQLLGRTFMWTFINIFFHVTGGLVLALLLNNNIRLKGVYRMLLVIPWAMPQVVAVLAMRGEFLHTGFVNTMLDRLAQWSPWLASLGVGSVQWLSNHAFATCTIINIWLGIPFMMVVILGGLQSISTSYYDAASIDGATAFQKFKNITVPLLRPVIAPSITLGTIWTFNNINVIYLVTGQAGGTEDADILVTALYKSAFTFSRYSYSAAFAIVVFIILFLTAILWLKYSKGTESIYGR